MVPSPNFTWLSRGVPLLGAPGTGLLCPSTLWGSIKRIWPEYWIPAWRRGQPYPQLALSPVPELWLRVGLPGGSELRLTTWRPPSSCTPGFSKKRIFPEYWPAGPGTYRTLLHMMMFYHKSSIFYRCLKKNYIEKCFHKMQAATLMNN